MGQAQRSQHVHEFIVHPLPVSYVSQYCPFPYQGPWTWAPELSPNTNVFACNQTEPFTLPSCSQKPEPYDMLICLAVSMDWLKSLHYWLPQEYEDASWMIDLTSTNLDQPTHTS